MTSFRKAIRLGLGSARVIFKWGYRIFKGMPGNPAPVPTSTIGDGISKNFPTIMQST